MCADMFEGNLLKNKSAKRSQKQNRRKNKKRKEQRIEMKFKEITELISADTSQKKEIGKNGKISEKAPSVIEEYTPSPLEENGQRSVTEAHQSESTGSESESDLSQLIIIIKLF